MGSHRQATAPALALLTVLAACTFPPLETPTPTPSPSPTPTASPTPSPTASPTPSPSPTPDPATIPGFEAGEVITSRINGLRVRQRPGVEAQIVTGLLPLGAEMEVIMGPLINDQIGWYLVSDADPAEPEFEEGWVAAGYEPDPLLGGTGRTVDGAPYVISMAATGDAEEGPIELGDGDHAIRWVARDPEGVRCTFGVTLDRPGADPVPTIRATVGNGIDRGTLQPETFAALSVRGPAFVSVTSDCTWALVLFRVTRDDPSPTPSPSPS